MLEFGAGSVTVIGNRLEQGDPAMAIMLSCAILRSAGNDPARREASARVPECGLCATASGKPVLMKVNYDNGHFTEDKDVTYANFADQFAFVLWQCGHPEFQMKN